MASIRPHPSTGRPTVFWRDLEGRRHAKSFNTKTEARAHKSAVETDLARGDYIDPDKPRRTYAQWAEEWWPNASEDLSPARSQTQRGNLRNHILPRWGTTPLGRIDAMAIAAWVRELSTTTSRRGRPLSPSTVRMVVDLFARSLRAAAAARWIRETPMNYDLVKLPPVTPKPERYLNHDEVELFVEGETPDGHPHLPEQRWRLFCELAAWSGARWGEIAGLRRADVDVRRARVTIAGAAARNHRGTYELKAVPKNHYSRRTISIPERVAGTLGAHMNAAPAGDLDLVFPNQRGGVLIYSNWREDVFEPAVERAAASGLERFTFHDLRHTHVTWLIDAGWDEAKIVRRMGWRDSRVLHLTYRHFFDAYDRELVDGLVQRAAERGADVIPLRGEAI